MSFGDINNGIKTKINLILIFHVSTRSMAKTRMKKKVKQFKKKTHTKSTSERITFFFENSNFIYIFRN